jgi:hypothetical protein
MGQQERNSQKIIPRLQGSIDNVLWPPFISKPKQESTKEGLLWI